MDQTPGAPPPPTPEPPPGSPPPDWGAAGKKVAGAKGFDLLLLVAGALYLIASFLPWYRITFQAVGGRTIAPISDGAWGGGGLGVLAALCGIGAGAVALVVATGSKSLSQQSAGLLAFVLATSALFFTFLRVIVRPTGSGAIERLTGGVAHVQRGYGLWLALLLALVMTFAGYQKYRQHAV
jgi:hypothetical protein